MKYSVSDDSITLLWELPGSGTPIHIMGRELRRERTGVHGRVGIAAGGTVLRFDNFNLSRAEERTRLSNGAHKAMADDLKAIVSQGDLGHELDMFCLYACSEWEMERVQILDIDPAASVPPAVSLLPPHILRGTGNILFAPPGTGKSWLALIMAVDLASGIGILWPGARPTPVLYVDLERNDLFFRRRLSQLGAVVNGNGTIPHIPYLKGRGLGLASLKTKIKNWIRENEGGIPIYDSISRMGGGSLKEDDVANSLMDMANAASDTWIAIAHSPRDDAGHVFGSQMFDAAADTVLKLSSAPRGPVLGFSLAITKANHAAKGAGTMTYQLTFGEHGLERVERSDAAAWPELATSLVDSLAALLDLEPKGMTATELAKAVKAPVATVRYNLDHGREFARLPPSGKEVYYTLAARV